MAAVMTVVPEPPRWLMRLGVLALSRRRMLTVLKEVLKEVLEEKGDRDDDDGRLLW